MIQHLLLTTIWWRIVQGKVLFWSGQGKMMPATMDGSQRTLKVIYNDQDEYIGKKEANSELSGSYKTLFFSLGIMKHQI